jgi:hypothetical protein
MQDPYGPTEPMVIDDVTYPRGTARDVVRADLQARVDARNKEARATLPERRKKCETWQSGSQLPPGYVLEPQPADPSPGYSFGHYYVPPHDVRSMSDTDLQALYSSVCPFVLAGFEEALDPNWESQYLKDIRMRTYVGEATIIAAWTILPSIVALLVGCCIGWVASGFLGRLSNDRISPGERTTSR